MHKSRLMYSCSPCLKTPDDALRRERLAVLTLPATSSRHIMWIVGFHIFAIPALP